MPMPPSGPPASRAADALPAEVGRPGSLAVAHSGGVDSTVVLAASLQALGRSGTLAAIADSPALARGELLLARRTAPAGRWGSTRAPSRPTARVPSAGPRHRGARAVAEHRSRGSAGPRDVPRRVLRPSGAPRRRRTGVPGA
ncbi:hypothetical protein SUDANB58_00138 [Streptomyces sp. enrichment culture]|uniref:hypothetical protein n=1 Tax=Streptomyces sp. enrichment culture TaxID=1795815 RepID=UPI003F577828